MYRDPYLSSQFQISKVVKWLIIANIAIWIVFQLVLEGYMRVPFREYFALYPSKVLFDFHIWQLFSYMFLHSLSVGHILFNMLMLWFIGTELEQRWGSRSFLIYYLVCGAGAAIIYCFGVGIYHYLFGGIQGLVVPVIGASGAIFGLLLAYGILFGERTIHFMMLFPMKAKYFVMLLGAVEVLSLMTSGIQGGEVAYLAHLGGIISGYLALIGWTKWQRLNWSSKGKSKKKSHMKLVVDNEKDKPPKYWS